VKPRDFLLDHSFTIIGRQGKTEARPRPRKIWLPRRTRKLGEKVLARDEAAIKGKATRRESRYPFRSPKNPQGMRKIIRLSMEAE
jgi:hypothetical protein